MSKNVRYILLCEDKAHERFIRAVLKKFKGSYRELRSVPIANGISSGEQRVREHFPSEIRELRRRSYQKNLGFIVVTDADRHEVKHRIQQLNGALSDQDMHVVAPDEPVLMVIPKWCLETWVVHLIDPPADESEKCQVYKNQIQSKDYRAAAKVFSDNLNSPPDSWLPSMKNCAVEFANWLKKLGEL